MYKGNNAVSPLPCCYFFAITVLFSGI